MDRRSQWIGLRPTPGVISMMVLLLVIFLGWAGLGRPAFVLDHLALTPRRGLGPEPWQLLTNGFFHLRFGELFSVAIGLWFFGSPIERMLGRARLYGIALGAVACGSLAAAALGRVIAPEALVVGAVPVSAAYIAAFGAAYARTPILLFGVQQMRASTMTWAFLGITAVMHLIAFDFLGLASVIGGAAFGFYSTSGRGGGELKHWLERLRLWRLRRRYKVISGGRDAKRDTERYLN